MKPGPDHTAWYFPSSLRKSVCVKNNYLYCIIFITDCVFNSFLTNFLVLFFIIFIL